MDLAELKFKVNTDELALAAKKIEALGTAVSDLNDIQKQSATINREEAKASKDKVQSDTAQVQAKNKLTEATENSTKASKAAVSETDRLNKLTTNLENTFKDLSKGFTRGESSVLNLARSFGASAEGIERVKAELAKIGTLIKDPFDAAIGSVRSINQEFDKVTNRTNLAAQGIVLTTKQLSEYSRVATEISAKILSAGLDPTSGKGLADFTKGLERVQQKYLGIAESVNIANNAEKERQRIAKEAQGPTSGSMDQAVGMYYKEQARAMRESSSAAAYLEKEMKRVDFVLNEVNAELQLSTSNRLLKFEESLKRTGVTGTQAATKIEAYRKSLQKIDETRAFKRQTDDLKVYQDKVNYVTRAVGPQLTDIFSGLLTGQQSLYTIAVQQGGQLADQFSLAGIEANKMGGILAQALPNMYTNIANIGKAFGQMAIGGFLQLGDTLADVSMKIIPFGKNISEAAVKMQMMGETGSAANKMLANGFMIMADTARIASAILATTLIGSIIAFGVAAYQVMKEQNELSKALTLTGVSLGMSRDAAVQYAESLKNISGTKAIDVLTEFAKAGVNSSESLEMMIQAAVDLEKYGGVAIADTAKEIKKLQDEPLKALVDLAIATGKVTTETLEKAKAYAKAGDAVALLQLAEEEQARVAIENSGVMRDNLTSLERGVNNVTSAMKYLWEEFKSLARGGPIVDAIASALKLVAKVAVEVFFYVKSIALQMNGLSLLAISAIQDIGSANFDFSATKKAMSEIKTASATIVSERAAAMAQLEGTSKSVVSVTAEVAKAQSEAAKSVKANLDISQELDNKILQSSKKKLTQIEFENQAVEKYRKSLKGLASDESVVAKVRQVAAQEWKDAQTKPKVDPSVKLLNQDLEKLTDIKNKALGLNKDYNNSEATLVRLLNQGHINLVEYTLAMSDLNAQQPRAIKLLQEQAKAQNEVTAAWKKTNEEQLKLDIEYFKDSNESVKQRQELELQTKEIEFQINLVGKSEDQQKQLTREFSTQNKLRKVQVDLERELEEIKQKYKGSSEGESLSVDAYRIAAEKIKAINAGVALEFALDMQREFNSIKATITDAVVTALFDGGKAGSKKLRDSIVAAFRNKITVVVDAVVNTITGGITGSISNASGLGSSAGTGGTFGILSAGKGIYDAISGGFSSLGTSVTSAFSSFATSAAGQSMGLSTVQSGVNYGLTAGSSYAAPTVQLTKSAASMAKSAGVIASYAGAALAGIGIGSAIGGNKVVVGLDSKSTSAIGAAVGSFFGPVGTFVGGALGGVVSAAFGMGPKQTNASGISGTFGASTGANVQQYSQWSQKGGWFRSDKSGVDYSAIAKDAQDYLNLGVTAITAQTKAYAEALGLNAESIAGFTKSINISLMGLDAEGQQKAIDSAIVGFGSSMAETLLGTFETITTQKFSSNSWLNRIYSRLAVTTTKWKPGPFVKEGETAGQALQRLATSLVLVNSTFDTLEVSLLQVSLTSANAASTLIDAFGGVEAYAASMQSYFTNFYSENEQIAKATENAGKAFAALGIVMPAVNDEMRAWYRSVVEQALALDQGVLANAQATAAILGLQGMVNDLAPSMSDTANATSSLVDAMIASSKKLQDAINETRRTQMQPAELVKNQQYEFDRTYALALSTTGETRIGYADELATILPDLSEAIKATSSSNAEWMARTAAAFGQAQNLANLMGTGTAVASISSVGSAAAPISTATAPGGTSIVFDNSAVVLAVDRLNANIDLLRMEVQADVMHNAKTAKLLDRVIPDGESVQVTVLV